MKKKFNVLAKVTTYCTLEVEAETEDEALEIAENTDGGDFESSEQGGDFNILSATEIGEEEPFIEHTVKFTHKGFEHTHTFTPTERDYWEGFESHGIEFDLNYDEEYNFIVVYEVINGKAQTQTTLHKQNIVEPF